MIKFGEIPNGNDNVPIQFSIIMSAMETGNEPFGFDSLFTCFWRSVMGFLKYPDHGDKYLIE